MFAKNDKFQIFRFPEKVNIVPMHEINNQFCRWRRNNEEKESYIPQFRSLKDLAFFLTSNPEVLEYTSREEGSKLVATTVTGEHRETFIILCNPNFVSKNWTTPRLYVDATFSVRPKGCGYQMLTIMFERFGQVRNGFGYPDCLSKV